MLLLFVAVIGGTGCSDSGRFSSPLSSEEPNPNPETDPEQDSNDFLDINELGNGDLSVEYNENKQIVNIEGNYSNFIISNTNDALKAINLIRNNLGISEPSDELETFLITSDDYGSEYSFQQIYKNTRVLGRAVITSVNSFGEGDFLHSTFLSSDIIAKVDNKNDIGKSDAENKAKSNYTGNVEVNSEKTEKVIYSLNDYEINPTYAYIVSINGTSNDTYVDERIIIDAKNGNVIDNFSNLHGISTKTVDGFNELREPVQFTVLLNEDNGEYYLIDSESKVFIISSQKFHQGQKSEGNYEYTRLNEVIYDDNENTIYDVHSISAYTNIIEIMQWWKSNFKRNSLDNNGCPVIVVTHGSRLLDGFNGMDQAFWNGVHILIGNVSILGELLLGFEHTYAAAIDVLTHETTHAIIQFDCIDGENMGKGTAGAINEAYADIFGCIKDHNWEIGEYVYKENSGQCIRNIANPEDNKALSHGSSKASQNNDSDIHIRGLVISHAAYLMHESNTNNGLTWEELGNIWYKSIHMGLSSSSTFQDVRRCVIWAAKKIHLDYSKIDVIKKAFDDVEIRETKGVLRGTVTDYDTGEFLSDVKVTVYEDAYSKGSVVPVIIEKRTTPSSGRYSIELEAGRYNVFVDKVGYILLSSWPSIEENTINDELRMDVRLVKRGYGYVSGVIRDKSNNLPLAGVTLNIKSGWYIQNGTTKLTAITNMNGEYTFDLGEAGAGYYTIEMIKDGYETSTFNITVSGQTIGQNGYIESNNNTSHIVDVPINENNFPDEYFRGYVLTSCDLDGNGILSKEEIEQVKMLDASRMNIPSTWDTGLTIQLSSLKGVEYFYALEYLDCGFCKLTTLDISNNTALKYLDCYKNKLTELDVSNCTALASLNCGYNQLTKLDISKCTSIGYLDCINNYLTELDVSQNTELEKIRCFGNQISNLDLSNCPKLNSDNVESDPSTNIVGVSVVSSAQTNSTIITSTQKIFADKNKNVITVTHTATKFLSSGSNSNDANIVAILPDFRTKQAGTYSFDVTFGKTVVNGNTLFIKDEVGDLNGNFFNDRGEEIIMPLTESLDHIVVSATFEAGETYSLLIAAKSEEISENGSGSGCNLASLELLSLLFVLVIHKKNAYFKSSNIKF